MRGGGETLLLLEAVTDELVENDSNATNLLQKGLFDAV